MSRKIVAALILALGVGFVSNFHVSAANVQPAKPSHVAQTAATCSNTDFITSIGKDMSDLGAAFKATDMKSVSATAQTFLSISATRQKYENMTVSNDCIDLQIETILAFSNASDVLVLDLAALTDTANASAYTGVMPAQATRFQNSVQNVLILAGVATPAANSTPVGRTGQITSTTCSDSAFLSGLATDFGTFSSSMNGVNMQDMTSISKTLLNIAAMRQKYEDLIAPSGCEITQLTAIVAFANTTDLLGLGLAAKADPTNAATYTKVLGNQATRTQQWIQRVLVAAGVATPSATMAATAAQ